MLMLDHKAQCIAMSAKHLHQSELVGNTFLEQLGALLNSRVKAVQHGIVSQGTTSQNIRDTGTGIAMGYRLEWPEFDSW
jgi:hypothetical protein